MVVGGQGRTFNVAKATEGEITVENGKAYNGGGTGTWRYGGSGLSGADGGGATHIAYISGFLYELSAHATNGNIIIVAGGGGGGMQYGPSGDYVGWTGPGGNGGGINGNRGVPVDPSRSYCLAYGGTQTSGGQNTNGGDADCDFTGLALPSFGKGGGLKTGQSHNYISGGGGGYYGGAGAIHAPAAGGSGYIGSSNLISGGGITKHMTCYSCTTSTAAATRTNSNTNAATSAATADRAKLGNGYARITWMGDTI